MSIVPGARFGPYQILELVGRGGMGEVYRAHDPRLGRDVAVKILPVALSVDPDRLRRFEQEARAAAALNHPNILAVYDIGTEGGAPFIVSELLEGGTLRRALANGPLPVPNVLEFGIQIALGLAAAHRKGVVHRDLKPENIFVTADDRVKILDFGLAKLGEADSPERSLAETTLGDGNVHTLPGTIHGTIGYMSPEQARGLAVDSRTDLFSLGVVLYELLAGQRPFTGDTASDVLASILLTNPVALRRIVPEVPPDLDALVGRALAKHPDERCPSAEDFVAALRQVRQALDPDRSGRLVAPPRFPGLARTTRPRVPSVGRDAEKIVLDDAFRSTQAGNGLILCLAGEPGIGKTTVVEDFLWGIPHHFASALVGRGRCSESLKGSEAHMPIIEALEALLRGPEGDFVTRTMKVEAATWYAQVRHPTQDTSSRQLMAELRSASQDRLKRELATFLERLGDARPVVLLLEDLQWSDVSTIDLLAYLGSRLDSMRVLIIVTYRFTEMQRTNNPFVRVKLDLQARGLCRELQLTALNADDVKRYIDIQFPGHTFPPEFLDLVYFKTEGYPLFLVDVLRHLRDREVLQQIEGVWTLADTPDNVAQDLPESVRSMIQRKLEWLDDEERKLLAAASLQGHRFRAVVVASALESDEATVEERLQRIEQRYALIESAGEEELPDGRATVGYRFTHGLYQNALYATLTTTRRAILSRATAEAVVKHFGVKHTAMAPMLGLLFEAGREFSRAAEYFSLASQIATNVMGFHEAKTLAERGLEAISHLADNEDRARLELTLRLALLRPLTTLRGFASPEVEATYRRVSTLSEMLGERRRTFHALAGFCIIHMARGEMHQALKLADECMALAERGGDGAQLAQAHWQRGQMLHYTGGLLTARDEFEAGLRIYNPDEHHRALLEYGMGDGPASSIGFLARVLWLLGYADQARRMMDRAMEISIKLNDPWAYAMNLSAVAYAAVCLRDVARVEEYAARLLEVVEKHRLPSFGSISVMMRAWTVSQAGDHNVALPLFSRGFVDYTRTARANVTGFLEMHLQMLLAAGEFDRAVATVDEAKENMERSGERNVEAEIHRLYAEALQGRPDFTDTVRERVETVLLAAIQVARTQHAKSWELRARMSLARLFQRTGRTHEAHQTLERIVASFTEGFGTQDLQEATALLGRLAASM